MVKCEHQFFSVTKFFLLVDCLIFSVNITVTVIVILGYFAISVTVAVN